VIPAYNEAGVIADTLGRITGFTGSDPAIREIIVVDDGSRDDTAGRVRGFQDAAPSAGARVQLVQHASNLGKGAAVRTGLQQAGGDVVLFTDADLSSPIAEMPRLVQPVIEGRCDIAIGSRAVDRSLIEVRQQWSRETAGRIFNVIVRGVTGLPILDTQCGFKAFRREAILPLLGLLRINTFAFDVELLYLASRRGLRILEIPVRWSHVEESKVHMLRDSARMFRDVLAIRLNDWRGYYSDNGRE
jgi:glycosyltransferase involved in cell wall biosynthesis